MRYPLNSMSENLLGGEEYFLSPKNFFEELWNNTKFKALLMKLSQGPGKLE